ncbi:MAG TPA: acyl-CoA dehydrogenase [Candidatus Obscuribacterales bacterium]|jgi:acyl-CoA dehydrogenase|nr:acyl-CoA dehydrogenase [Candidatus Obscuribacterales bacterium]
MSEFNLSEEQREFQKLAHDFSVREVAPKAAHFDESGEVPLDVLNKAFEAGLTNVMAPESAGGLALPFFEAALIQEELATGCSAIAGYLEACAIAILPLIAENNAQKVVKFVQPLMEKLSFAGFSESMLDTISSEERLPSLKKNGSEFELTGNVRVVAGAQCDWFVVKAKEDSGKTSLLIVDKKAVGVKEGKTVNRLGRKCLATVDMELSGVKLPADHLVGTAGGAEEIMSFVMPRAYLLFAASAIGISRAALAHSITYAKERKTFGRPIGDHQAIAFMMSDMAKDIEAAKLLTYAGCQLVDQNVNDFDSAAIAKVFAQEAAMRIATDAVQIFGGYGYSREYPVEKLMRDAKTYQITAGTSQRQLAEIGRKALVETSR